MKHNNPMQTRETMSALADGQLQGEAFAAALAVAARDPEAGEAWHCYHLIGDALRASDMARTRQHDTAFLTGLRNRLAAEPAPVRGMGESNFIAHSQETTLAGGTFSAKNTAANDPAWRWKMAAGFASVAAVGVLAWSAGSALWSPASPSAVLAQSTPSRGDAASAPMLLVASPNGAVLRDPRLDDMLAAHRQLGGNTALQMPAGFLRNATFEGAAAR